MESRGYQHIYVDGGQVISSFLSTSLIDEMIITRIPILLGRGIPLFSELDYEIKLGLISAIDFEDGFTQNKYRVLKKTGANGLVCLLRCQAGAFARNRG